MLNWLILKFFLGTIIFLNDFRTHLMMFLTKRKFAPDLVVTWKPSGTPDLPKQALNSLVSEDAWKKTHCRYYSGGDKTSVKTLTAYISHNKAKYPINLGAKWKLLISRFQNSPWMLHLELNWQRYDRKTEPNLNCKKVSNESYF